MKNLILIFILVLFANCSLLPQKGVRELASNKKLYEMSREEINELIEKQIGPIVPREKSEILYDYMEGVFNRLSDAHEQMIESERFVINRFSIIDTLQPNAFVIHLERKGVSASENVVMVTTELLRRMMEGKPGHPLEEENWGLFEKRIVGILGHELAHPLDDYDESGFAKNHGKKIASQAREIRADSEGGLIAKKAGYSQDCVYEALLQLFKYGDYNHTVLEAAYATHPEKLLRHTSQRLLLTATRYEQGKMPLSRPHEVHASVLKEVQNFFEEGESTFIKPNSIEDAVEKIIQLTEKGDVTTLKIIEYNRLLMELGEMLNGIQEFDNLSEAQQDAMKKLTTFHATKISINYKLLRKKQLMEITHDATMRREISELTDWSTHIEKNHFFSSKGYQSIIFNIIDDSKAGREGRVSALKAESVFRNLERLNAPWAYEGTNFGEVLRDYIEARVEIHGKRGGGRINWLVESIENLRFEYRVALTDQVANEYLYKEDRTIHYLLDFLQIGYRANKTDKEIIPLTKYRTRKIEPNIGVNSEVLRLKRPGREGLNKAHKKWINYLWSNREALILLDFSWSGEAVDWEYIWDALGIDHSVGKSKLNQSVKSVTQKEVFADLLKRITNQEVGMTEYEFMFKEMRLYGRGLAEYFAGEKNEIIKADPVLLNTAKEKFLHPYLSSNSHKEVLQSRWFNSRIRGIDFSAIASMDEAVEAINTKMADAYGKERVDQLIGLNDFLNLMNDLNDVNVSDQIKKEFYKNVFWGDRKKRSLKGFSSFDGGMWVGNFSHDTGAIEKIYQLFKSNKYVKSRIEFFRWIVEADAFKDTEIDSLKGKILDQAPWLKKAISELDVQNYDDVHEFAKMAFDYGEETDTRIEKGNLRDIRELRHLFLDQIEHLDAEKKFDIFNIVTTHGSDDKTDAWFKDNIFSWWKNQEIEKQKTIVEKLLETQRITSHHLKMDLIEVTLGSEIDDMVKTAPTNSELYDFVRRLNRLVPSGSGRKDAFLEKLAWALDLTGIELKVLVEEQKSINWRTANPTAVNMGSMIASLVDGASTKVVDDMIGYALDPFNQEIPKSVEKQIFEANLQVLRLKLEADGDRPNYDKLIKQAKETTNLEILKMQTALKDSSVNEKTTIIEMLLNGDNRPGEKRLIEIARKFGGYSAETTEEKLLKSFLRVIPEYERSVTIAYLLASQADGGGGIKAMFEVFQTVGIKFGQLAAIWNIFGDDVTKKIEGLRDNAAPMSKSEIEKILKVAYGEKAEGIKLKQIFGSASVKTVVQVELPNGDNAVLMVRRPFIEEQIKSNLKLASDFLEEAKRIGVDIPKGMFEMIIEDLGSQLGEEIDFRLEAKKMARAQEIFNEFNKTLNPGDYKYHVPQIIDGFPVHENVMIVEMASGSTWRKLTEKAEKSKSLAKKMVQVGKQAFRALIRTFTINGFFNPDSHGGNLMIDHENGIINIIDLGQTERFELSGAFTSDDRLLVAKFLDAYQKKDATNMVKAMSKMSDSKDYSRTKLIKEIANIINNASNTTDQAFVDIVTKAADNGLRLERKFSFGLIKGLIVLTGEGYVDAKGTETIISEEFNKVAKKKLPALFFSVLRDQGCMGLVRAIF